MFSKIIQLRFSNVVGCFFVLFFLINTAQAGKLKRAFEALEVYNYFKAKELFEKSLKRQPAGAAFGLSLIYANNKNPFYELEKAYVYILKSDSAYRFLDEKDREKLLELQVDSLAILQQKKAVSHQFYQNTKEKNSEIAYQQFIDNHPWANELESAIRRRNQLAFDSVKEIHTYEAYNAFLQKYPDALQAEEAQAQYDVLFFKAQTAENTLVSYQAFLLHYGDSPYVSAAQDSIYQLSTRDKTISSYERFIRRNPQNRNVNTAWQRIYALYTDDYTPESISEFLLDYPNYPYRNEAFKDFELAQIEFVPFKAKVGNESKWGFVDTLGNVRIEPQFQFASGFTEGLAVVGQNNKMGFVNKKGELVIAPEYDEAFRFDAGMATVIKNDLYGSIDKKGNEIIAIEYEELGALKSGLILAKKNDLYGYLLPSGEVKIDFKYQFAYDFEGSYALVENDTATGLIDVNGIEVVPIFYEKLSFLTPEILKAKTNGYFGIITVLGDTIVPFEYDYIGEVNNNRMLAVKENEYHYLNLKGHIAFDKTYPYEPAALNYAVFQKGYAIYKNKKGHFGIIDTLGSRIFPAIFDNVGTYDTTLTAVKRYGKWGYANADVQLIIGYKYTYAWPFENGMAKVEKDRLQAIIDEKGETIIPFEYASLQVRPDSLIRVETSDRKKGLISMSNVKVLPPIFDQIQSFSKTILSVEKDGKMALYNTFERAFFYTEPGFLEAISASENEQQPAENTVDSEE